MCKFVSALRCLCVLNNTLKTTGLFANTKIKIYYHSVICPVVKLSSQEKERRKIRVSERKNNEKDGRATALGQSGRTNSFVFQRQKIKRLY